MKHIQKFHNRFLHKSGKIKAERVKKNGNGSYTSGKQNELSNKSDFKRFSGSENRKYALDSFAAHNTGFT